MGTGAEYFDREYFELHEGKRRYLEFLVGRLQASRVRSGDVLDVGSGFGFFLQALARSGYRAIGLERSPFAVAAARRGFGVAQAVATAEDPFPFRAASFDAVTLLDVIEHVRGYPLALRECYRVLRPGGRILVITLNRYSAARPLLGRRWSWYQDPTHVHMFSVRILRRALAGAGFDGVRAVTLMNFCAAGETTRILLPLRHFGRVAQLPAFGDSILVEGARPER